MSIRTLVCSALVAAAAFSFSTETFGQRGSLSWNQGCRILGGGQSAGYHWRTPGPYIGYYNPWSHHNTALRTGIVPQGAASYLYRHENCGDAMPTFDEPLGFGQGGDFIGESTFETAPDQPATSNGFESNSTQEPNRNKTENYFPIGNENNELETDASDSTQSWPGFSSSQTGGSVADAFPAPDRDWAERFWSQRK